MNCLFAIGIAEAFVDFVGFCACDLAQVVAAVSCQPASQFAPLPAKYFEGVDPLNLQQAPFWQKPIGSGPFKIEEVVMNDYTTLVPFEGYHKGTAKIEQIIARPSGDNDGNLLVNATAGKADFGYTKVASDVPALEALDFMNVHAVDIPYTRMIWINQFPKPAN